MKHYTSKEKEDIYLKIKKYTKKHYNYVSEYGALAYTDEFYAMWEKILKAE